MAEDYSELDLDEESSEYSVYNIKIEQFEGPLDVLLKMVKTEKIPIKDIFVSDIIQQYIEYISSGNVPLDHSTEFIVMAAILIEIKAKSLLPRTEEEKQEDDNEKQALISKIEEYELYKKESEKLKAKETIDSWNRQPDTSVADETIVLKDLTMEGMLAALKKIEARALKKKSEIKNKEIERDPFTVEEKIILIKDMIDINRRLLFENLFEKDATKNEIITTFQALLELIKNQYVKVSQENTFGDITVEKAAEEDN